MPKLKPSRLNSTPSTALTDRPSSPPSESCKPCPLGAGPSSVVPVKSLPMAVAGRSSSSSGTARLIQAVKVLELGPGHSRYSSP